MSRTTVECSEKHTPISPRKNRIRRDMLRSCSPDKDIITISHGALDALMMLGWEGRIQTCDIDPGVRESIEYLRDKSSHNGGDYPDLNLLPPGSDIADTVRAYCQKYGVNRLGIVDVDLASSIGGCMHVLQNVMIVLQAFGYRGRTFFTFRNGRDCFGKDGTPARIKWLKGELPCGVSYVSHTQYRSVRLDPHARRSVGSAMCIVELQHAA